MIASANHLLTQVKDNQPRLRQRLALGSAGRKPRGCARSETKGRNRFEARELEVFDAKAWFSRTPWEKLIKTVLRLQRTIYRCNPATGLWKRGCETVFWVSSASGFSPEQWNAWIRGHWRIENGSHYVRDATFAEDASRIRKNPDIAARQTVALPRISRATTSKTVNRPMNRARKTVSWDMRTSALRSDDMRFVDLASKVGRPKINRRRQAGRCPTRVNLHRALGSNQSAGPHIAATTNAFLRGSDAREPAVGTRSLRARICRAGNCAIPTTSAPVPRPAMN